MLILGEQYTFSKTELKLLEKQFKALNFIQYNEINPKEVIAIISSKIVANSTQLIILNTKAIVPNELLVYLTKLEYQNIQYISIKNFIETYLHKCYIPNKYNNISFLEEINAFNKVAYWTKLFIDYVGSFSLLFLTSPVLLYAVYKIKKESPGSVIFKQTRVGLKGKEFTCYKFRSMHENSHHDLYTRENDSRIYPWGNFMRKTRIDELPQLINILKGDMHLIGPRAEWDQLVVQYEEEIPYYYLRHSVKPGITGWAQVNYPYGANIYDTKQKLMYDLYYIKHWSLWLEIKTVWKTCKVVILKQGI